MAYVAPVRRSLLPLLLVASLAACSTDTLDIDSSSRVSAIQPQRQHRQRLPEIEQTQAAYPVENGAPLESANLAGQGYTPPQAQPLAAPAQSGTLPPIDSDEALALNGQTPSGGQQQLGAPPRMLGQLNVNAGGQVAGQPAAAPQPQQVAAADPQGPLGQGVSMDDGLGVGSQAAGSSLAQEEAAMIAETNPSEPVVGGIGTDNPVAYPSNPQPAAAPASAAEDPLLPQNRIIRRPHRSRRGSPTPWNSRSPCCPVRPIRPSVPSCHPAAPLCRPPRSRAAMHW